MSSVAGFRLASGKPICRECPKHILTHPIESVIPRAEAGGLACSVCGNTLVPHVIPWRSTLIGAKRATPLERSTP